MAFKLLFVLAILIKLAAFGLLGCAILELLGATFIDWSSPYVRVELLSALCLCIYNTGILDCQTHGNFNRGKFL